MRILAEFFTVEINNGVNDNRTIITRFSRQFIARDKYNAFRFTAAVIYVLPLRSSLHPPLVATPKNYIACDAHLSRRAQWWNHLFGIACALKRIYTIYARWWFQASHSSGWLNFFLGTGLNSHKMKHLAWLNIIKYIWKYKY